MGGGAGRGGNGDVGRGSGHGGGFGARGGIDGDIEGRVDVEVVVKEMAAVLEEDLAMVAGSVLVEVLGLVVEKEEEATGDV